MFCVTCHHCLPVWLWMLTVPPLQTSKTVLLLRLLRCSLSCFTLDRLKVSFLSLLSDSRCSLCDRSLAATLATLTRSLPRWRWSWRRQTNSSSWTWTRTSSRASPTPTPSLSFRSEEPLRDSAPAQLRSSTDSSSIPSPAPVPSQASSASKLDDFCPTYMQILTLCGFRCCFLSGTSG